MPLSWVELWGFEPQTSCMPYDFAQKPGESGRVPVATSPAATLAQGVWRGLAVRREWPTDWPTVTSCLPPSPAVADSKVPIYHLPAAPPAGVSDSRYLVM